MPDPVRDLLCDKVQGHPCRWECWRVQQGEQQIQWHPILKNDKYNCKDNSFVENVIFFNKTDIMTWIFLLILKYCDPGVQEVLRVRQVWLWHRKGGKSNHQILIHSNQNTWCQVVLVFLLPISSTTWSDIRRCAPTSQWKSATLDRKQFSRSFRTQLARGFLSRLVPLTTVST